MPTTDSDSELQELQYKANRITDESLESTRRMVTLCEEGQDAGVKTLAMLDAQGEQLDNIEKGMDKINADMKEAEKNLTGMDKCCGLFVCPCNRKKGFKEDNDTWKGNDDGKVNSTQPTRISDERNGMMPHSGFISKINTNDAREDEMDDNMQQVSTMIGNLRNMAIDMGSEIEAQDSQINRITQKGQSNSSRINLANYRTNQILKS